ncbi:MAG: hypothetical protein OEZ01_01355 [Candidatus Heimdallarchaeota archaeon]|nr:hypothetical protein [Candidatus Heimdallarchaeota archaeon]MDH5644620.1 hypothetical protein [Candidatus Heimdallarchaeota archaeon]
MRSRKAVSNIVATMLIFSIMIISMGVLYNQIAPTLLGFDAETKTVNQEFVFSSIANTMQDLIISSRDSQRKVSIVSNGAVYDIDDGHLLQYTFSDNNGVFNTTNANIGGFYATVEGSFQKRSSSTYLNRVDGEASLIHTNESVTASNYIAKVDFDYQFAIYSLYFKSRLEITNTGVNQYDVTLIIIKMDFIRSPDGVSSLDFPHSLGEWDLRLKRSTTIITSSIHLITGPLVVGHSVDGQANSNLSYAALAGSTINLKIITVPILFTI